MIKFVSSICCNCRRSFSLSAISFQDPQHRATDGVLPYKDVPISLHRELSKSIECEKPLQAWLETLKMRQDYKLGFVDLHPHVFGSVPRPHVIHSNLRWQGHYRLVDYRSITVQAEITRGRKKPYPQKGLGKARHGDTIAPQFYGGSQVKGPRGPESFFYIPSISLRVQGLIDCLSAKYLQNDLHIVDDLELGSSDIMELRDLIESRGWGTTVLFVNDEDKAPSNIAIACYGTNYYNLMAYYGLNVWSMCKHDTLVMTVKALDKIESRILLHLNSADHRTRSIESWDEPTYTHFSRKLPDHDSHIV